jgi:hypothetical protein
MDIGGDRWQSRQFKNPQHIFNPPILIKKHPRRPNDSVIIVTHEPGWLKESMERTATATATADNSGSGSGCGCGPGSGCGTGGACGSGSGTLCDGDLEPNVAVLMDMLGVRLRARCVYYCTTLHFSAIHTPFFTLIPAFLYIKHPFFTVFLCKNTVLRSF